MFYEGIINLSEVICRGSRSFFLRLIYSDRPIIFHIIVALKDLPNRPQRSSEILA